MRTSTQFHERIICQQGGKMNMVYFYDPLYMVNYHVFFGGTIPAVRKYLKNMCNTCNVVELLPDTATRYGGFFPLYRKNSMANIIWLRSYNGGFDDIHVLSHEVLHAAIKTLESAGVLIDDKNDESICYYHGLVLRKIHDLIKEHKTRFNRPVRKSAARGKAKTASRRGTSRKPRPRRSK